MKAQFGEIIGGISILTLILPLIILGIIITLAIAVVNWLKLPIIFIIALISYSLMYKFSKEIVKRKDISISIAVIFSVILSYMLYINWLYIIVSLGILIPLYGIANEMIGSPIKEMNKDLYGGIK